MKPGMRKPPNSSSTGISTGMPRLRSRSPGESKAERLRSCLGESMAQPFMQSSSLSIERLRTQFSLYRKGRAHEQSPTLTAHFCSSSARPTRGNVYGVGYGVVIVPLALTVIWTGGRGLVAGAWGLVPSALKIAPCAGQLNCPVDALYLTATPACVQACSTATKVPLLIWTSQLACLSAGVVTVTQPLLSPRGARNDVTPGPRCRRSLD